jgi:hypothetical protein
MGGPGPHGGAPYVTPILRAGLTADLEHVQHLGLAVSTGHWPAVLCCPFKTPASALGVGGGGFHGIRSVGGGAQPLKQPSGAFRRWVHCVCARR